MEYTGTCIHASNLSDYTRTFPGKPGSLLNWEVTNVVFFQRPVEEQAINFRRWTHFAIK